MNRNPSDIKVSRAMDVAFNENENRGNRGISLILRRFAG